MENSKENVAYVISNPAQGVLRGIVFKAVTRIAEKISNKAYQQKKRNYTYKVWDKVIYERLLFSTLVVFNLFFGHLVDFFLFVVCHL